MHCTQVNESALFKADNLSGIKEFKRISVCFFYIMQQEFSFSSLSYKTSVLVHLYTQADTITISFDSLNTRIKLLRQENQVQTK